MAQGAKSKEPSMDEILASIRRIIAEDDTGKSAQRRAEAASVELNPDAAASVEAEPNRSGSYSPPSPESPAARLLSGTAKAARSSIVLDLIEPIPAEAASVELNPDAAASVQADPDRGAAYSPPSPESPGAKIGALSETAKAACSSTIFDLTEPMASSPSRSAAPAVNSSPAPVPPAPDHAVAHEAVTQSGGAGGAQGDERSGLMSSILSGTAKAARSSTVLDLTEPMASSASRSAAPAVNSSPAPVPTAPPDHAVGNEAVTQSVGVLNDKRGGLMSSATSAAVDSAFNALAQTVLVHNVRTLEDLVREMLRPMLKVWLDDNLPGIVERLVRAEIERVSRGPGG